MVQNNWYPVRNNWSPRRPVTSFRAKILVHDAKNWIGLKLVCIGCARSGPPPSYQAMFWAMAPWTLKPSNLLIGLLKTGRRDPVHNDNALRIRHNLAAVTAIKASRIWWQL